ncbi:HNH endonuclease [Bradyrhizobium sp. Gha]|uniref:HNH endonuclease n=1 Tax=Bradyrhizobium sp. Gha TaxID=1855318 RepID=UPI0008DF774E|nr:HNH endonuclease [Bradyrhizobium sp. Gha]SFK04727.1 HNH endonuclease [Bradyrhizobium sp. Gha]
MITAERLRQLVVYDPATGTFTRDGKRVGSTNPDGYLVIRLDGRTYLAHRLAWLYMKGEWPQRSVSFRDHDRANLRWTNLRLASPRQTACSRKASNKLGVKGVRAAANGNFRASIYVDQRHVNLGTFATVEAAGEAYAIAARVHFGEFARSDLP